MDSGPFSIRADLQSTPRSTVPSLPATALSQKELSNGLQVLVASDYSAPVVSIQLWCATGSIHEGQWLGAGISHLLEHLMFKGTPTRGNSQMAQEIHDLGGHLNAYTSFDRTVYHVDLPSDNWQSALEILSDAVFHSVIPADEFESEKEVIRREFAMGDDNPDRQLSHLLFRTAFTRHPYRFPVIGHLELFNQVTRDDVLKYYQTRYVPDNVTLLVCGAVDAESVFATAEKLLSSIERKPLPDLFIPNEPLQVTPRFASLPFPTEIVRLALVYPIPGLEHPDVPALDLLSTILGGGRSSRLNQSCVEKNALAEEIEAFAFAPGQSGVVGVEARCYPEKKSALEKEIRTALEKAKQALPATEELDRAKRLNWSQQIHSMKTMSGQAASLGRGWLLQRDPQFSRHYLEKLQEVTPEDVLRVAQHYLDFSRETHVELVPQSPVSTKTQATGSQSALPKPVRGKAKNGITSLSLNNPKLPLISFRSVFPSGLLSEPKGQEGIGRLAVQLLLKGTRQHSAEALARKIEGLGGAIGADAGNNSSTISLELLNPDAMTGLDLFAEILDQPAFQAAELETEKRKQLAGIKLELDQPMAVARNLVRSALFGQHSYAFTPLGTEASVSSITIDQVIEYANLHLRSPQMVFSVAGDIGKKPWPDLLADKISDWSKVPAAKFPADLKLNLAAPQRVEKRVEKEQAVLQIAFPTPSLTHPDHLMLDVLDEALSDLGSRLFIRIREELGLAYFVGTSQFLGRAAGYFVFYVGTDPKKRSLVETALLEEISRVATEGITQVELDRARAKMLSQEKLESQNPSWVAYASALDELYGLGFDHREKRLARLEKISLAEVNQIANGYFRSPGYVIATVSPE